MLIAAHDMSEISSKLGISYNQERQHGFRVLGLVYHLHVNESSVGHAGISDQLQQGFLSGSTTASA